MKTKLFAKIITMAMALCMCVTAAIPAFAAEVAEPVAEENVAEVTSVTPRTVPSIELAYTEAKTLTAGITINQRTYIHIGTIHLEDSPHINRILYSGSFQKASGDTGGGHVSLDIQFRRNGSVIYEKSFPYSTTAGLIYQEEVQGVAGGQTIEVWADASSVNPAESNGSIRQIYLNSFSVYTD